jgi:putative acetyltransferase
MTATPAAPHPHPGLAIRSARRDDVPALRTLYAESVRALGPSRYSPAQVAVWAAFAQSADFAPFLLDVSTFVAELGGTPAGFCGIAGDGHLASVYVAPAHAGRGIATALLRHALAAVPAPASGRWYAEASLFSLPLFLRQGFVEVGREQACRQGVRFERYRVERHATATDGSPAPG